MNNLYVAGYRPLTSRLIGHAPPSTVVPISKLNEPDAGEVPDAECSGPPEHGYSAFHAYGPSEVLFEDFSAHRDASTVHPLGDPMALGSLPPDQLYAFEVRFSADHLFRLERPTLLHAHGHAYEFTGFMLLTHHALRMPVVQLLCGGETVDATLVATQPPEELLSTADERVALTELHELLYERILGLPDFEAGCDAAATEGEGERARHLHFLPRFLRVERGMKRPTAPLPREKGRCREQLDASAAASASAASPHTPSTMGGAFPVPGRPGQKAAPRVHQDEADVEGGLEDGVEEDGVEEDGVEDGIEDGIEDEDEDGDSAMATAAVAESMAATSVGNGAFASAGARGGAPAPMQQMDHEMGPGHGGSDSAVDGAAGEEPPAVGSHPGGPQWLSPRTILDALSAPTPNVLQWLCEQRSQLGATVPANAQGDSSDTSARAAQIGFPDAEAAHEAVRHVSLHLRHLPATAPLADVEAYLSQFGVVRGSVRRLSDEESAAAHVATTAGPPSAAVAEPVVVFAVDDAAAALELLSSTHLMRTGEGSGRTRVTFALAPTEPPRSVGAREAATSAGALPQVHTRRAMAWGTLSAELEERWKALVADRLVSGLVRRVGPDGAGRLWRVDKLELDQDVAALAHSQHRGLHLANGCQGDADGFDQWQPLLVHSTQLDSWRFRFRSLLLRASECEVQPLKCDVTQHALTLPTIAHLARWFVRASKLQA